MDMYAKLIELEKRVEALEAERAEPVVFSDCHFLPPLEPDPEPTLEPGQAFDPETTEDDMRAAIEGEPEAKPKKGRK